MSSSNRTIFSKHVEGQNSARNFIENSSAHDNTLGWNAYADAAGTRPIDGTGGSPAVTWSRTTTNPLSLDASFQLVKDANNRQGQGVSYDFSIDRADQAKMLKISFDYEYVSGTYSNGTESTDSDLIAYIYDVTNSRLIEPVKFKVNEVVSGQKAKFESIFAASADSQSYRLIIHVASTSASAYTINFDRFNVYQASSIDFDSVVIARLTKTTNQTIPTSTQTLVNWEAKTYDTVGAFDLSTDRFTAPVAGYYKVQVRISYTAAVAAVNAITLYKNGSAVSTMFRADAVDGNYSQGSDNIYLLAGDYIQVYVNQNTGSDRSIDGTASGFTYLNIEQIKSAVNAQDNRGVIAVYKVSGAKTTDTTTPINYDTKVIDTHSAVTTGSGWKFTAPQAGTYLITNRSFVNGSEATRLYVNGSASYYMAQPTASTVASASAMVNLNAGQYIDIRAVSSRTTSADGDTEFITIAKIQSPQVISPTETIAASAYLASNTAFNTTIVKFDTKEFDTHSAYSTSTGQFTCPAAGIYRVSGIVTLASGTPNVIRIRKNTTTYQRCYLAANAQSIAYSVTIQCVAGDTINVLNQGTNTVQAGDHDSTISIERIGV